MCSDLYLLDIFINLIYYYCYNYYNYYNYFIPHSHLLPPAQFRFRCFYLLNVFASLGTSRPPTLALVSLGLFFVCV